MDVGQRNRAWAALLEGLRDVLGGRYESGTQFARLYKLAHELAGQHLNFLSAKVHAELGAWSDDLFEGIGGGVPQELLEGIRDAWLLQQQRARTMGEVLMQMDAKTKAAKKASVSKMCARLWRSRVLPGITSILREGGALREAYAEARAGRLPAPLVRSLTRMFAQCGAYERDCEPLLLEAADAHFAEAGRLLWQARPLTLDELQKLTTPAAGAATPTPKAKAKK
jgi:hypothetical protein